MPSEELGHQITPSPTVSLMISTASRKGKQDCHFEASVTAFWPVEVEGYADASRYEFFMPPE